MKLVEAGTEYYMDATEVNRSLLLNLGCGVKRNLHQRLEEEGKESNECASLAGIPHERLVFARCARKKIFPISNHKAKDYCYLIHAQLVVNYLHDTYNALLRLADQHASQSLHVYATQVRGQLHMSLETTWIIVAWFIQLQQRLISQHCSQELCEEDEEEEETIEVLLQAWRKQIQHPTEAPASPPPFTSQSSPLRAPSTKKQRRIVPIPIAPPHNPACIATTASSSSSLL